jgi:hypothetical protein
VNAARLVELTITVPNLEAAVAAWRAGIGLEAVVEPSTRRARIEVQGIAIVLVESREAAGALSGITLASADLEKLRAELGDITLDSSVDLMLDPTATSGAPITLVEAPAS